MCVQADAATEWRTCAALFAAGEVALLREARPPSPLMVHVQALTAVTSSVKQEEGASQLPAG